MIQFDEHIFHRGWNHQLGKIGSCMSAYEILFADIAAQGMLAGHICGKVATSPDQPPGDSGTHSVTVHAINLIFHRMPNKQRYANAQRWFVIPTSLLWWSPEKKRGLAAWLQQTTTEGWHLMYLDVSASFWMDSKWVSSPQYTPCMSRL